MGRLTRRQQSKRPPTIYPEVWLSFSKKEKERAITEWNIQQPIRDAARLQRGSKEYIDIPIDEHAKVLAKAQAENKSREPTAPAMPLYKHTTKATQQHQEQQTRVLQATLRFRNSSNHTEKFDTQPHYPPPQNSVKTQTTTTDSKDQTRPHQPHFAQIGNFAIDGYDLIHTPLQMPMAMKIPNAKQAVNDEWDKLAKDTLACPRTGRPAKTAAWDINSVRPKAAVQAEAKRKGITTHFGSLMDLCHEKHSEITKSDAERIYKGRVVFRGDQVRDEN
jgi:hypothetical protein